MKTIGIGETPKKYNMKTAKEEAKRRWGAMAFVQSSRYHFAQDGITPMKGVGKWIMINNKTSSKEYFGWAETWEDAFDKATKNGH